MNLRTFAVLAVMALAVPASGCLVGSSSRTEYTGDVVGAETLAAIEPGTSAEAVTDLLGEPTTKTPLEDGREIWKWRYREVTTSESSVFLLFSSTRTAERARTVYVEFRDGVVSRAWRDGSPAPPAGRP